MQAQALVPLSFSLPRRSGTTGIQVQKSTFWGLLGFLDRFFAVPKRAWKTMSKKWRKKWENQGFWPPKTWSKSSQNTCKIDVPKNMQFFIDFGRILDESRKGRPLIFAGRAIILLAFHSIRCFACCMPFGSQKPTKNPSKTTSEPFKNRCRKRIGF